MLGLRCQPPPCVCCAYPARRRQQVARCWGQCACWHRSLQKRTVPQPPQRLRRQAPAAPQPGPEQTRGGRAPRAPRGAPRQGRRAGQLLDCWCQRLMVSGCRVFRFARCAAASAAPAGCRSAALTMPRPHRCSSPNLPRTGSGAILPSAACSCATGWGASRCGPRSRAAVTSARCAPALTAMPAPSRRWAATSGAACWAAPRRPPACPWCGLPRT